MNHSIIMKHSKTVDQNKAVWFAPEDDDVIVLIENSADFSESEIERCWYSREEKREMEAQCYREADLFFGSSASSAKKKQKHLLCSRGLETLARETNDLINVVIHACIDAVMDEQEIQWSTSCDDFDRLALASQQVSKRNVDQAIIRAIQDEKEARTIYKLDEQKNCRPRQPIYQESEYNLCSSQRSPCIAQKRDIRGPTKKRIVSIRYLHSAMSTTIRRAKAA